MDGKAVKFSFDFNKFFETDKYGSTIPKPDALQMEYVQQRVERQLSADTGLASRMTEMCYKTDVEFTDNPYGNTPVLGFGVKMFGARPSSKKSFNKRVLDLSSKAENYRKRTEKRQAKILNYQKRAMALHQSLKPEGDDPAENLLWLVEGDQVMTGGGFDGNSIGEVHKSALKFVTKASAPLDYKDTVLSKIIVEGALWLKRHLQQNGLTLGTLEPYGASKVRFEQDKDGMIGYPLFSKGNAPLTKELATRLLIETGVSTTEFVGSSVSDRNSGEEYKYRVIDAVAHCLDRMVISPDDAPSIVWLLARIQKHGWKMDGDEVVPKPGKTRSVYPNAAIPGILEGMIIAPFNDALQRNKVPFMPSLQDKSTRVGMITQMIKGAFAKEYDYLAADWSQYDATVKGSILSTVIQLAVKPFFRAQYYDWVDFATIALTHKYIMGNTALFGLNPDEFREAKRSGSSIEVDRYTLFGLVDGLISGAKFTHVGGSMYGEVVVHYAIPKFLNYEPMIGAQAGDDTLLAIPKSMIDLSSSEATYNKIADIAKTLGLDINPSKQIWHQVEGEVVKVFLQEVYHFNANIWGVGSILRPYDALPFTERDKGLSIAEQLMAEISRMNQGYDSPFVKSVVKEWLEMEQFLGALFKEYGVSAFDMLIQTIGQDAETIAQRIDVGSFTWGFGIDELRSGSIPILPIIAEVAAEGSYVKSAAEVLKLEKVNPGENDDALMEMDHSSMYGNEEDILDD